MKTITNHLDFYQSVFKDFLNLVEEVKELDKRYEDIDESITEIVYNYVENLDIQLSRPCLFNIISCLYQQETKLMEKIYNEDTSNNYLTNIEDEFKCFIKSYVYYKIEENLIKYFKKEN